MSEEKTIYVVFKTHFDIGFTELAEELLSRWGSKMLPDVVNVCEATQKYGQDHKYVWTMPAWPLNILLNEGLASKEMVEKAKELIKLDQLAWHVLPFTTHTEFCGLEEYVRGMYFSKALSEEYGKWPISAKMTDVVGHTWILPSLLSKAGVKFLHIGPNAACKLPEIPQLFFWEGPDHDRVLTFYSKTGGYGSTLLPPKDWPFPVWLALMHTNDNIGPQGPEIVEQILTQVEKAAPGTKIVLGTMDDFYHALSEYSLEAVPVVRGDLADTWIHGTGSYPNEVGKLRALRHTLTDTEKALSFGIANNVLNDQEAALFKRHIEIAYEKSILFGEHTWGLTTHKAEYMGYDRYYKKEDLYKNGDIDKFERSWDEQRNYVIEAAAELAEVTPHVLNGIACSVNVEGARIVIFNSLGWKRDAWVDVDRYRDVLDRKQPVDLSSHELIELTELNGKLHVLVKQLPAFGYKTLVLHESSSVADKISRIICNPELGLLENWRYRIIVDREKGTIKSFLDKSTGHDWVGEHEQYSFGQYHYDVYSEEEATQFLIDFSSRFYDWQVTQLVRKDYYDQEHINAVPTGYSIEGKTGAQFGTLIMKAKITDDSVKEYGNAKEVITEITLYEDQPYFDIRYDLKYKEKTFCVEAGHFVFPINLQHSQIHINKLGSVINPAVDIIEGTNHHLYCCENWVDITDGEKGMAVIPLDTHLFSIGSHGILNFRRSYQKEEPILMFNAFNNSYGCNFPQWMDGDYAFRYRLIPHEGDWKQGEVARRAFETVAPPLVGFSSGEREREEGGYLPAAMEWIEAVEGMEIMSIKQAEKRDGFIMRLREIAGESHTVKLSFIKALESISSCDLLERVQKNVMVKTNWVQFDTKPFEIHSFHLIFAK